MNAISFTLYGDDPRFCIGALKNVFLARRFYPDWTCIFFVDRSVRSEIRNALTEHGAIIKDVGNPNYCGYFWRFLVADMPEVKRFIVRDTDSRIGEREALAVQAWTESGERFHTIRDHPHHTNPMMGGMWGAQGGILNMKNLIDLWPGTKFGYDSDQQFLRHVIWPITKDDVLQHDTCCRDLFPGSIPLPSPLSFNSLRFVGEVFDEFDQPREYDWEKMINFA